MRRGLTRSPACRGPQGGWCVLPSPFRKPQAAGRRPFLDPREIVVTAVAVGPHRQVQRTIGLGLALEFTNQRLELSQRVIGGLIGWLRRLVLESQFQRRVLARRVIAADAHISQLADGGAYVDAVEAALAQDRGLQRQLRR